jgi:hypothetical protein
MSGKSGDYGSSALIALILGLAILAALNHIEKVINRQTDLMARDIAGRRIGLPPSSTHTEAWPPSHG